MMTTYRLKTWCVAALMCLTATAAQAQDVPIRRQQTTKTETTTVTTQPSRNRQYPVSRTGTIKITSTPTGAVVKIGGTYMGETPLTLEKQQARNYIITISADGYESQTYYIGVIAGEMTTCSATLKKKQTAQQPTHRSTPDTLINYTLTNPANGVTMVQVNGVTFKMLRVEGGTFTMGATSEQGGETDSDESPTHRVTLSTYYIGETEVTQALWQAVMGSNPSKFKGSNLPVEQVSWEDICGKDGTGISPDCFLYKLNKATGRNFRLPTEAEWEYAARGGNRSKGYKYSGSNSVGSVAWYKESGRTTHPVKTKQANELGLYDMSGNVMEWCQDWYGSYSSSAQTNPTGANTGSERVIRGGCCNSDTRDCRVSNRLFIIPTFSGEGLGLRLAL